MSDDTIRSLHPVLARINEILAERRISVRSLGPTMGGTWTDAAVASWLRGDRHPTLGGVATLANVLDLEIGIFPKGVDVDGLHARVAELEAENAALRGYVARHAISVDEPALKAVAA